MNSCFEIAKKNLEFCAKRQKVPVFCLNYISTDQIGPENVHNSGLLTEGVKLGNISLIFPI